jgi:multiple sugar transport system substrate-binding protein
LDIHISWEEDMKTSRMLKGIQYVGNSIVILIMVFSQFAGAVSGARADSTNPPVIAEGGSTSVSMDENGASTPFSLALHATGAAGVATNKMNTSSLHGTISKADVSRAYYLKASAVDDWVHAYGWADGTELTLEVGAPGDPGYYTSTAKAGQAPWDPIGTDIVAIFDLTGHHDLQVGDVLTVSGAGHSETYTVPDSMTEVRWFIGLGAGSDPSQIPTELAVTDDYNASQSNIELIVDVEPNASARDTLAAQIAAGNVPDLVGPVGFAGSSAFHGQWKDLSTISAYDSLDTGQFTPALMDMYHTDEGQAGLPIDENPSALYYNPALFDAADLNYPPATYGAQYEMPGHSMVDWNWDTLAEVGKLLTLDSSGRNATNPNFDANAIVQYGFSFGWEGHPNYWGSFWKSGSLVQGSGPYTAAIPDAWKDAWQWYYNGAWGSQPFIPNGSASDGLGGGVFVSGKVAMLDNPSWYLCCIGDVQFQFGAMPTYKGAVGGRIDTDAFRILKDTAHPDQAFDALSYLVTTGVDKLVVGTSDTPSAYNALPAITDKQQPFWDAEATQFPFVTSDSWKILKAGLNYPDSPNAESWMPNFNQAWDYINNWGSNLSYKHGLSLPTQETILEADLTAIFNGLPTPIHPYIEADPGGHWLHGRGWPNGTDLHLTITRTGTTPYETDAQVGPAPWDSNDIVANFVLWNPQYDLQPGDVISMIGAGTTVSMTVPALQVTDVNAVTNTVAGTADAAGGEVHVWVNKGPDQWVPVDSGGHWTVDFSPYELKPGMDGGAQQYDDNGNLTQTDWRVQRPWIEAGVTGKWVQARDWPLGADLTMTINGSGDYSATVGPNGKGSDPFDTFAEFDKINLHSGDVILITDGTNSKSYTVTDFQVTGFDLDADSVSGSATPGARVQVCVNLPNSGICRWMNADGSGHWSVNYSTTHDPQDDSATYTLKPGDNGWAAEQNDAGDQTQADWHILKPRIEADPAGHWIHGVDWPNGTSLHLTITRTGTTPYEADAVTGPADWDPNTIVANFNLWNPEYDLHTGDVISMTGGGKTASMTVGALQVTDVNAATNTVAGTVDATDGQVHVWVNGGPDQWVPVDSGGHWTVDFSPYELKPGINGGAEQFDDSGNLTRADWRVQRPWIEANVNGKWVQAHEWPMGADLTMKINGSGDYSATAGLNGKGGDPFDTFAQFDNIDLQIGDIILITDGTNPKSYTVTDLQVTGFDLDADSVSGNATPGARVQVCVNQPNNCISRWVNADGSGHWSVNYSTTNDPQDDSATYTLKPGDNGWASEQNEAGDQTWYDWHVLNPHIEVDPAGHWMRGVDWPNGTSLHLTITRTGTTPYEADAVTGPADWDPNTIIANFNLWDPRYDLQTGDEISMAGGSTTVSMTVGALQVTDVNAVTNTVAGTADAAGGEVHVWVNGGPDQWVPVDSGGHWTVDFSPYELKPGMDGGAQQYDDNGNLTQTDWRVQRPWIEANVNGKWVQARDWPLGADLTMTINGSGDYSATVGPNGNAKDQFDTFAQFDKINIHSGDVILITDGTNSKSYTVTDFQVTGFDLGADSVSGSATPGARVQVCVNQPNNCISRWVNADGSGHWSVNYSSTNDPQDDSATYTLKPGDNGWAAEQNDAGDQTWYDWHVLNPHIEADPAGHWVNARDWPNGTSLHMTITRTGTTPYEADAVVGPAPWDSSYIVANFNLWDPLYDLQAGDEISMAGGGTSVSMTVAALQVTSVNAATNTVAGMALAAEGDVHVWVNGGPDQWVPVDSGGHWTADFSPYELKPGINGSAQQFDDNGNLTQADWRVQRPWIQADVNGKWVQAHEWPLGAHLTMTINGSGDYTATEQLNGNAKDQFDTFAQFDNIDLHVGDVILITDETNSKSYTVTDLQVTGFDLGADSVSGNATPGARVQVCVNQPNNCISRWVNADGSGHWSVNYSTTNDPQDDPATYTLQPSDKGWASEQNEAGDQTWYDWFVPNTFTLTVSKSGTGTGTVSSVPTGIDCGSTCSYDFDTNDSITLTATTATGSTFTGWTGSGCSGTGTCKVSMSKVRSVSAAFTLNTYVLSVGKTGTGSGTVTSDTGGIDCGSTCFHSFDYNTVVTLSATPATGSTFNGWSGSGCSGTGTCIVTMSVASSVSAAFTLNTYLLSVGKTGTGSGTVTSDKPGINCGSTCSYSFNYNTVVTLTASAATGSTFTGWSGSGCSGTGTCIVTMSAAKPVSVNYTLHTYTISGNAGVGGATLSYTGGSPVTASSGGVYTITVPYGWSGTVTPSKTGYTFSPTSRAYTSVHANQTGQNYTALVAITGNAGVGGATLSYTGGSPVTASSGGVYTIHVAYGWSGTVTPSKAGYTFSPTSRTYTSVHANQTGNYTATLNTYTITGNAGDAGVVLHYTDGTAKTVTSASNGRYTITIHYGWSGTVTPSKTGVTFNPTKRTYTSLAANQTAQNYTDTITLKTSGTYDGWILESARGSGVGGTLNSSATTFQLGDDISNRQYRAILSFNTAGLPDTATLTSAVLKIDQSGTPVGTNPFTVLGSLYADIKKGFFGSSSSLELADFKAAATAAKVGPFGKTPVSGWYSASLTSTGRGDINKTSLTQFRLYFSTATNLNNKADYMKFLSGNSSSNPAQLIITYTLP